MAFVADASIILAWAFEEHFADAEATLQRVRGEEIIVPSIWWFEVRNVLVHKERRGRQTEQHTTRFLRILSRLAIRIDPLPDEPNLMNLARRRGLTVYDAAYLELALRHGLELATLAAAARAEGVAVIGDPAR